MIEIVLMNLMQFMSAGTPNIVPLEEYLVAPWNWFLSLTTITKTLVIIFGSLGFYMFLRIFYKIVEAIMAIFH